MASIDQTSNSINEIQEDVGNTSETGEEIVECMHKEQALNLEPLKELQSDLERLYKIENSPFTTQQVLKITQSLKQIKNERQVCKAMGANSLKNSRCHKQSGYIRTQPRSISRRKEGAPRGARRIASGRPKATDPKRREKRPHNLAQNITANTPGARCH